MKPIPAGFKRVTKGIIRKGDFIVLDKFCCYANATIGNRIPSLDSVQNQYWEVYRKPKDKSGKIIRTREKK